MSLISFGYGNSFLSKFRDDVNKVGLTNTLSTACSMRSDSASGHSLEDPKEDYTFNFIL